jgi:DNA-directed RNA polymerase subunit RPC12/RpoP
MPEAVINNTSDAVRPLKFRRAIRCPRCGDSGVRRSRTRGLFDRLLRLLTDWRPFRCEACTHRFMARFET